MRVLFLVKNYIGFGHIRRTLLLAREIKQLQPDIDIIFISQAKSLKLFLNDEFRVINFPFIDLLPTGALISCYKELLVNIVNNLQPDLVIEDTYPDDDYLHIPSVCNSPKILVLRRIDPISFDEFRRNGCLNIYDQILVVQDYDEFIRENHTSESILYVTLSNKFTFFGPVFHTPSDAEINEVKRKYNINRNSRLVVINAGAGGDHLDDAYCDNLYRNVNSIACRFSNVDIRFIIVTGPYYCRYFEEISENVDLVEFEPNLPALLHLANIVIIRPGYNVTYEALSGNANIILIPGYSYMEIQSTYAKYLVERYGAYLILPHNLDELYQLIHTLINKPSDNVDRQKIVSFQKSVAIKIIEESVRYKKLHNLKVNEIDGVKLFIVIDSKVVNSPKDLFGFEEIPNLYFVSDSLLENSRYLIPTIHSVMNSETYDNYHVAILKPNIFLNLSPEDVRMRGVKTVLYVDENKFEVNGKDWCNAHHLESKGILPIELDIFTPSKPWTYHLSYKIIKNEILNNIQALYIDINSFDQHELHIFMKDLSEWLRINKIRLLSLDYFIEIMTLKLLGKQLIK